MLARFLVGQEQAHSQGHQSSGFFSARGAVDSVRWLCDAMDDPPWERGVRAQRQGFL